MATKRRLTAEQKWRKLRVQLLRETAALRDAMNLAEQYGISRDVACYTAYTTRVDMLAEMAELDGLSKPQPRSRRKA